MNTYGKLMAWLNGIRIPNLDVNNNSHEDGLMTEMRDRHLRETEASGEFQVKKKRKPYFYIFKDVSGGWRYNYRGANNKTVATGGEAYKTKTGVMNAIRVLRGCEGSEIRYESDDLRDKD